MGETTETSTRDGVEIAIVAWALGGVVLLLVQAIWRLTPLAVQPLVARTLGTEQACLYVAWVIFSIYAEGYRGFQKRFSPRVVARAFYLAKNPRPLHVLLAPAFCMSLFHATRRGRIVAWGITLMVLGFVLTVRFIPQPWRGIIDGGVVVGLGWGTAAILYFFARYLKNGRPDIDPDLPRAPASG